MRTTSARPKSMPRLRGVHRRWWPALAWLLFCAAIVAVGLFLSPQTDAVYVLQDRLVPMLLPAAPAVVANASAPIQAAALPAVAVTH